ncbi:MAG: glycoside hydrolase domain-containing protein, partial [Planctomycetota bacterium]
GHVLAGEAPMVAYLYSTYRPGNDKGMHDQILSQLGWSHHKWENVDVARLAANLDCYDLLLCHGIYNLGNPQDLKPYRDRWLAFLRRGGVIVVAGMQDRPAQWDWIVDLGKDIRFNLGTFGAFQKSNDWTNEEAELHFGPIEARWAQFTDWSPSWTVTNRNANGKPIVLYQRMGAGLIVVSTSYLDAFTRKEDLARIWAVARGSSGEGPLRLKELSWGRLAFGPNDLTASLHNDSEADRDLEIVLTVFNRHMDPVRQRVTVRADAHADASASVPYRLTGGENEVSLIVRSPEGRRVHVRTGTRCEFPDVWGPVETMDKDLKQAQRAFERLKRWPAGLMERLRAEKADLDESLASLRKEAVEATSGPDELFDKGRVAAAKAGLLAAKVEAWANLGLVPGEGDRLVIFAADSLQKIYRDTAWPADLPKDTLLIELARNEYESAQVVIVPLEERLENVSVACGALSSPEGQISDVQVRPVADCYLPIEGDFGGWRPDVLLKNAPFEIPEDRLARSVWITVRTALDTPAGVYEGSVTVSADGAEAVELPVRVRVWDFALPEKCNLPTQFNFRPNQVATYYFGERARFQYWKHFTAPMYREFVKFLLQYRIAVHPYDDFAGSSKSAIGYLGEETNDRGEVVELDFTDYDKSMQILLDHGQDLLYAGCWLRGTLEQKGAYWRTFLPKIYAHLKEKGWDTKAFIYGYDEVPPDEVPIVKSHYALIKELAPTLRYLLTYHGADAAPPADELGYADIWVPQGGLYSQELAAARARYGQATWRYIVPGFEIYRPTSDYRNIFWSLWRDRCQGFLYFCTAFWFWGPTPADFNPDGSPKEAFLRTKKCGTGIYHLCYPAGSTPEDGLNASIRPEAIRDGLEDWEYLHMLRGLLDRSADPRLPEVTGALKLLREIDEGGDQNVLTRRRRVAEAIERLLSVQREM